jgi:VanZ family protein
MNEINFIEKGRGRELNSPQRHMSKRFGKERWFYLVITLILAVTIFYASTIKTAAGVPTGLNLSAFYHFGAFFMFTFFLFLTIKKEKANFSIILLVFMLSIAYAISDEIHQLFVPGRLASIKDLLIDGAGNLCAILLVSGIEKKKN